MRQFEPSNRHRQTHISKAVLHFMKQPRFVWPSFPLLPFLPSLLGLTIPPPAREQSEPDVYGVIDFRGGHLCETLVRRLQKNRAELTPRIGEARGDRGKERTRPDLERSPFSWTAEFEKGDD